MPLKSKTIILFFLFFSFLIPEAWATDFGEDEEYLGQVVDDYINDDNVSTAYNVINNSTLDCMELEYTEESWSDQNFTTYTEVDSDADILRAEDTVTWTSLRRDANSYVYYDFGAGHFGDFYMNITLDFSDIEAGDISDIRDILTMCALSNIAGTYADMLAGDLLGINPIQNTDVDDVFDFKCNQYTGGGLEWSTIDTTNRGLDPYYLTFKRIGATVTLQIYSDMARTTLLDTITEGAADQTTYRYLVVLASNNPVGGDPADHSSGVISNLTIRTEAGGYSSGYYYTTEILGSDKGLVCMYNATIEEDTVIKAEFSSENSTWVDHNNQAGFDTLVTGFESLDIRDLNTSSLYMRFNMTTDGINTPRIYQLRFVTITEVVAEGDTIIMGGSGIFWVILIIVVPIVAYMVNKK